MKKILKTIPTILFAILILGFVTAPLSVRAGFFDDLVDFLNPKEHIKNIKKGKPLDNLPPLPPLPRLPDIDINIGSSDRTRTSSFSTLPPPPSISISANPISVNFGESSNIFWNTSNATSCFGSGGANNWAGNRSISGSFHTGPLTNTTTFHITCSNSARSSNSSVTIHVSPQVQNPTVSISANPTSVNFNESSTIIWNSSNATSCNASGGANNWAGSKSLSGAFHTGSLANTTTFHITCSNNSGSASGSTTVFVSAQPQPQNPTVSITADDNNINFGESTRIRWNSSNATFCSASGGANNWSGSKNISGSFNTGPLFHTTTFHITCSNSSGSVSRSTTVFVSAQPQPQNPTVSISADDKNISFGESTRIRWNSNNATFCNASGGANNWSGSKNLSGTFNTGPLFHTTTFTISCSNHGNHDTRSVTVVVGSPPVQQPVHSLSAVTTGASHITTTSARLNSTITSSGNDFVNAWFEWGKTINLGNRTSTISVGALPSVNHVDIMTGLSPGTIYYYRAVAENSSQRSNGLITSFITDGQKVVVTQPVAPPKQPAKATPLTSFVLMTSAMGSSQPRAGDEINYTVNYQNSGTGAITNLSLRIDLPQEMDYIYSNPGNPIRAGNTLVFNLGTLKANEQGSATINARLRSNVASGTSLNIPATLYYVDPAGQTQTASSNVSAQVWGAPAVVNDSPQLGANVVYANTFFPSTILGWFLLIILILILLLLSKYLYVKFSEKRPIYLQEHVTKHDR